MMQRYGLLQEYTSPKICLITCVFGHRTLFCVFLRLFCIFVTEKRTWDDFILVWKLRKNVVSLHMERDAPNASHEVFHFLQLNFRSQASIVQS